jgi:hypothetical protein
VGGRRSIQLPAELDAYEDAGVGHADLYADMDYDGHAYLYENKHSCAVLADIYEDDDGHAYVHEDRDRYIYQDKHAFSKYADLHVYQDEYKYSC